MAEEIRYSIIIPTRNRPHQISACLDAIAQLRFPVESFEAIVVDDGGSVALDAYVDAYRPRFQVSLIRQEQLGPAAARNLGAARARGTYLVFSDDDCRPQPDWLSRLSTDISESPEAAIGGLTVNGLPENVYSTASQMLIQFLCEYFNRDPADARFVTSSNLTFPAGRFRSLGGFSTEFAFAGGEDRELCDRWRHHGFAMRYGQDVRVAHFHALTFARYWRQHWTYGRGAFRFHRLRRIRTVEPMKIEPLEFYLGILRFPFGKTSVPRALAISGLLGISQVANAAGFAWEKMRSRRGQ